MILGVVTFFVISSKLGGFNAASEAVKANNPSKLIRGVDEQDKAKFEKSWGSWKAMSQYNYLTKKEKTLTLDEEQKETAYDEFISRLPDWEVKAETAYAKKNGILTELTVAQKKTAYDEYKPGIPNWEVKAETVYAKKNGMLKELTIAQKNDAYVWQDDRVAPTDKGDHWANEELDNHHLHGFPRIAGAELKAFTIFEAKIGHPNDDLDPSDPSKGKNWSRKKARGVYRATKWSPNEPRGISFLVFITYMFVPLSVGMFPHLFQHWLTAKSASSFKLPVVAHPLFIMLVWVPCVLVGAWATSATTATGGPLIPPHFPPNAVLVYMVKQLTTPLLAGFLTAGILAAIMSSLDSQFLCLGTIFTTDIAVHYGGKDRFTDKQVLIMARCFIIAIVALTYGMSLMEPRRVFTLGVWCFSGFSSLFPLILAALYWKKLTKAGSYACIITAIALWCYFFKDSGYASNPHYYVFGMMPVATMLAGSTAAMILVSLVTPPPSKETLDRFFPEES
ncbi:MAG: hypothetical protein COA78_05450 [Blastopirellula sp.]|nr:MAG: hypothetical protein COA78_05450 [Blastopirellula sp.]